MKKYHSLRFLFISSFLFLGGITYAAPIINSVEGVVSTNSSVTINGIGFGIKVSAVPYRYDDWEDPVNSGDLLNATGFWYLSSDNVDSEKPQYSSEKLRHQYSKKSAKFYYPRATTPNQDAAIADNLNFTGKKIYADFWVWYEMPANAMQHQLKMWKMQSGPGDNTVYPTFNTYHWRYESGSRWCYVPVSNSSGSVDQSDIPCPDNSSWVHYQLELETNDVGAANGSFKYYLNGEKVIDKSGLEFRKDGENHYNSIWLGKYLGNTTDPDSTTLYYEEVYFDDSWARIEIGDESIYENCTHREIQIPSTWSDTDITATVNQGAFQSGDTAYLFVVDGSGDVSEGYPITINKLLKSDFNNDGIVSIFDYNILLAEFGKTDTCQNPADTNGDCKVDIFDYNNLLSDFGKEN